MRKPARGARRVRQLLAEYRSSEDEDYLPTAPVAIPSRGSRKRQQATVAHGASEGPEEEDDDVPLAQRRRQLLAAQGAMADSGAAPMGASAHLPPEVIARVLQLACRDNAVPTLAAAACVCRTWRDTVAQNPGLWRVADLSTRGVRVSDAVVKQLAAGGRWAGLRHLGLLGCRLADAALQAVAERCQMLTSLDLSYTSCFTEAGLTAALSTMLLRRASGASAPLRSLNLSCIQVTPRASSSDHVLRQVLLLQSRNEDGPVLEELQVEGVPRLTHQGLRALCDASVEQRRPLLGALRMLRLTQSAAAHNNFAINIERLQYACPALEELGLNGVGGSWGWEFNLSPPAALPAYRAVLPPSTGAPAGQLPAVAAAAAGATPLAGFACLRVCEVGTTILHSDYKLSGRSDLTDSALARLVGGSPLLEHLDLSGAHRLTPDALATALHPVARLRRLHLAHSGLCSDEAVEALVERHGAALESIDLSWGGARVTDGSAVALARCCPRLQTAALAGTAVTDAGVRALVQEAARRGAVGQLAVGISSCRGVSRGVRQAASQGMEHLRQCLGL